MKIFSFPFLLSLLTFLTGLSGCVEASRFFAGNALTDDPAIRYPNSLQSVRIGVTTREEVQELFGPPTDRQQVSREAIVEDAWSYGEADPVIQPYQYLPLIGALAFFVGDSEPQSFSVNFSEEDKVEGISWRMVQTFGEAPYDLIRYMPGTEIPSYGTNNPLAPEPRKVSEPTPDN